MVSSGNAVFSANSAEWPTPTWLYNLLYDEFAFQLDPCATDDNAKCEFYYTKEEDGLTCPWAPYVTFVNPPYTPWQQAAKWIEKSYRESLLGSVVVVLLPVRTSNLWFHNSVLNKAAEIRFVNGRINFNEADPDGYAPFPSMIVIYRPGGPYITEIGKPISARGRK